MKRWASTLGMTLALAVALSVGLNRADAAKVPAGNGLSFEITKDAKKEYRWRLKAGNGKVIGMSDEGYARKDDCLQAIELIKEGAAKARIVEQATSE
jgi:uncharacterized protein